MPVTPETGHLIDAYLDGRTDGPLLRTSGAKSDGVPQPLDRKYIRSLLRRLAAEAELPQEVLEAMHPHLLRHIVATLLDEEGATVQEIQQLLGHADPRTTQGYINKRRNLAASPGLRHGPPAHHHLNGSFVLYLWCHRGRTKLPISGGRLPRRPPLGRCHSRTRPGRSWSLTRWLGAPGCLPR
ncbi:tyrosine-type recombinase/integrase [Actinomadura rubrisoli]|uniref:tyrosine-type recombinase/integrase n=1 Tax=Actinomadura rubrisoli TaxID=2530368 RepID=UPI0014052E21|nr:site-specific integrase [Actinomadura rubrisoli]